jgi:hypothetical protein
VGWRTRCADRACDRALHGIESACHETGATGSPENPAAGVRQDVYHTQLGGKQSRKEGGGLSAQKDPTFAQPTHERCLQMKALRGRRG